MGGGPSGEGSGAFAWDFIPHRLGDLRFLGNDSTRSVWLKGSLFWRQKARHNDF